ncbi:MAG: helix-hairpin-helix domain-containing protein [Deltaproteobacteria bacterium]|nr:helix-hairpin-helix domain-containing protein [Deltaproteobacteria bacterium]
MTSLFLDTGDLPGRLARRYLRISACASWLLLAAVPAARAADYDVFIDVETEEDLRDLLAAQEIDEESFEVLAELLNDGVDLNTASREDLYSLPNLTYQEVDAILLYRDEAGEIHDPAALVAAGVLSEKKLMAIAAFLLIEEKARLKYDTRGRLRYRTTYVGGDDQVPSMWLGASVSTFHHLDVGLIGVLTRNRLSDVVYDPNRDALAASAPSLRFDVPKFHVKWETATWQAVAGTYRIGFGQRLTFDNTSRYVPNGIRVDDKIYYNQELTRACRESQGELATGPCDPNERIYESPDYRWTDRLRGVAGGIKKLDLGPGWLQAYGWMSYQTRSIYQYEIYDRGRCSDPTDDENEACKAPNVYRRQDDPLAETSRFSYQTLTDMFNELLGGANLSYFFHRRAHVGVTGYGADIHWLVDGMDLDFQEWSRLPYGGPFGAVGLDAAWGQDWYDFYFEFARSFDSQPAGGGFAAILRATATWKKHEFEAAMRYYDKDFANPYGRPISAADEYDGLRARDEAGMRIRYHGTAGDLQLRASTDFWVQPSDEAPKVDIRLRADYDLETWFTPGLWVQYQDRDLADTGRDNCFEAPFENIEGEPVPCAGEKVRIGGQMRFIPMRDLWITAKYQHTWLDDGGPRFGDSMRQDVSAWLVVMYKPIEGLRLRLRGRYLFEDIEHNDYMEQSLWIYAEAAYWVIPRTIRAKLRYEVFSWLDDRESTDTREPNPAHWIRMELEYKF